MLTAAQAREITDDSVSRAKAREKVEKLSPWIKEQALKGKDHLLFTVQHLELEDFIVQEFKNLGYGVIKQEFWMHGCPMYAIHWQSKRKKEMEDIYYVRRGVAGEMLSVRMSTPDKTEALCSAAESSILNPGFTYCVYKGDTEIAKFYVKEEG